LGLFDVDFGGVFGGAITGGGDLGNVFSNVDGTDTYEEGNTVSAIFGNTRFDWTITYTGNITWTDADSGVVDQVSGPGTGTDVVLVGLGSEVIAVNDADFNDDGAVDGNDFLIWQRGFGASGAGDADGNGAIDAADLAVWKNQFGTAAA